MEQEYTTLVFLVLSFLSFGMLGGLAVYLVKKNGNGNKDNK